MFKMSKHAASIELTISYINSAHTFYTFHKQFTTKNIKQGSRENIFINRLYLAMFPSDTHMEFIVQFYFQLIFIMNMVHALRPL